MDDRFQTLQHKLGGGLRTSDRPQLVIGERLPSLGLALEIIGEHGWRSHQFSLRAMRTQAGVDRKDGSLARVGSQHLDDLLGGSGCRSSIGPIGTDK